MANGNGNNSKINIDTLLKISQILVIPLIGTMLWFLLLVGRLDTRLSVLERIALSSGSINAEMAVLENTMVDVKERLNELEKEFRRHQRFSTYDPDSTRNKHDNQ